MAIEHLDKDYKQTLILTKSAKGKIRHGGWMRVTDPNGDTTMQMLTTLDTSIEFDDIEFVDEHPSGVADVAVTNSFGFREAIA